MRSLRKQLFLLVLCVSSAAVAFANDPVPLRNWPVPTAPGGGGIHAMADISNGSVFVAVNPCRVVDTRNPDGAYGGPKMVSGTTRSFDIDAGPCTGIPSTPGGLAAFSLNFGVTETASQGYLTAYPTGSPQPTVATMTWFGGSQTLTNAAVVPADNNGSISVFVASTTHVIIDINGYYIDSNTDFNPGNGLFLYGNNASNPIIYAQNFNTTSASVYTSAMEGLIDTAQTGATAIYGEQLNAAGTNYAFHGWNHSVGDRASGVFGQSGTANWSPYNASVTGVRGISGGTGIAHTGVMGEGTTWGMMGLRVDATGFKQTRGFVGSSGSDGFYTENNITAVGPKSFIEPHPTQAGAVIKYIALEGPEAGTYLRGRGKVSAGSAVVLVPESFRLVTDPEGLSVQITPIGQLANYAVISADLDRIVVKASRDIEFYYQINGVRKAFRDFEPIQESTAEQYFVPESPNARLDDLTFNREIRERLISNGTFNADGSVNLATAERKGWAQSWRDREAAMRAYQAQHQASPTPNSPKQ